MNRIKIHAPEILQRIGLLPEKLMKRLVQKLDAKETQFFSHNGIVMDSREVVAHDIQLRAAIELSKMYGFYPRNHEPDEDHDKPSGPSFTLVITDPAEAARIMERLATRRRALESGVDAPLDPRPTGSGEPV